MPRWRPILLTLTSLLLGALTTTAVAWAIALQGIHPKLLPFPRDTSTTTAMRVDPDAPRAASPLQDHRPFDEAFVFLPPECGQGWTILHTFRQGVGNITGSTITPWSESNLSTDRPTYRRIFSIPDHRHPPAPALDANSREEFHFGWPMRAFWAATDSDIAGCFVSPEGCPHTLWVTQHSSDWDHPFVSFNNASLQARAVPTGLLPTGFAINSTTYALAWSIPIFARIALRRRRIHKGLCPHCRYDLSATPQVHPCPECGRRG